FQGSRPASERITTALIGSGARGLQIAAGGEQIVAVCDVDAKHREDAKRQVEAMLGGRGVDAVGDFREVLARDDLDAVIIASPDHWHAPMAMAAMQAGKAAYVEKPLSLTIEEGRILADAARRYRSILQVGSQQRSDEKFLLACELVRNGRIGELKNVWVEIPARGGSDAPWSPRPVPPELDYEMWLGPAPWAPYHPHRCHYRFRFVSDYSGGDVTNWGAHQLDIAQWGIGADDSGPLTVEGHGKRYWTGLHDVYFDVHVDLTFAGGVTVQLRSGDAVKYDGNGVRFEGTEGWVYVTRQKLEAEPKSLLTGRIGPGDVRLLPDFSETGDTHMGNWLHAIRTRRPDALRVPVEASHRSATVCHLANIAMELERPLQWDPVAEAFPGDDEANRLRSRPMREPWRV
ncbi:MAG: Gfo/Idh/MocA family oxidoreductase, partial [Thermoguttaceae bacterium]|nr:Gfo/Idh/MocA family oxidoreductase [Thermoguttaceae bacterium]